MRAAGLKWSEDGYLCVEKKGIIVDVVVVSAGIMSLTLSTRPSVTWDMPGVTREFAREQAGVSM